MKAISAVLNLRYGFIPWRMSLSIPTKIAMVVAMAGLTGLLAQVRIPLGFTPVPFTGQVMAVLLAGVLLGRRWGGASMALYAGLGMAGVPWFAGMSGGLGATTGYIVGFIPATLFLGYFIDKYPATRKILPMFALMVCATLLYYIPGVLWLNTWLNTAGLGGAGTLGLLSLGFTPFIVGDLVKALMAAAIAKVVVAKAGSNS